LERGHETMVEVSFQACSRALSRGPNDVGFRIATLLAIRRMIPVEISVKLKKRLEIMRAAGAIADFRIIQASGRTLIEIQSGDS